MYDEVLSIIMTGDLPFRNINDSSSIIFVGESSFGPSMLPIKAKDFNHVSSIFGHNSQLTNAYLEAVQTTQNPIFLIRLNGNQATYNVQGKIILKSLDFSENANNIVFEIKDIYDSDVLTKVLNLYNESSNYNKSIILDSKSIEEVVAEINSDSMSSASGLYCELLDNGEANLLENQSLTNLENGSSAYTNIDIYDRMENLLYYLYGINFSYLGYLFNNADSLIYGKGFIYELISDFCKQRAFECSPVLSVIGKMISDTQKYAYNDLVNFVTKYNDKYTTSEFIFFTVANLRINGCSNTYLSNGVPSICALIANSEYGNSLSSTAIKSIREDTLALTDAEKSKLSDLGFILFLKDRYTTYKTHKCNNLLIGTNGSSFNLVYEDDIQMLKEIVVPEPLWSASNIILVQKILLSIDEELNPIIGEPTTQEEIEALVTEKIKEFDNYIYEYSISVDKIIDDNYTNVYKVDISIKVYGELQDFNISFTAN